MRRCGWTIRSYTQIAINIYIQIKGLTHYVKCSMQHIRLIRYDARTDFLQICIGTNKYYLLTGAYRLIMLAVVCDMWHKLGEYNVAVDSIATLPIEDN